MSQLIIKTGTLPNDKTGDSLFAAFNKVNANFTELYTTPSGGLTQVNSDWDATSGVAQILHKPTIPTSFDRVVNGSHTLIIDTNGTVQITGGFQNATGMDFYWNSPSSNDSNHWGSFNINWGVSGFMNSFQMNKNNVLVSGGAVPVNIASNGNIWTFNSDGSLISPTLSVDLHNGGMQSGQVLKFNDANKQVIITGPTPATDANAQRIIIQGQRGTGNGEGGDVYIWGGDADVNGGDIKIYAGDGDASPSQGGYVHISGGSGYANGGDVTINAGGASQYGGNISLTAGYASGTPGNLRLTSNGHQWTFDSDNSLKLPSSTIVLQPEVGHTYGPVSHDIYNNTHGGAFLSGHNTVITGSNWSNIMNFFNPPPVLGVTTTGSIAANGDFNPGTPSQGSFNFGDSVFVNGYSIGDLSYRDFGQPELGLTLSNFGNYSGGEFAVGTEIKAYGGGWITLTPIVPVEFVWEDLTTSLITGCRTNNPFHDSVMGIVTSDDVSSKQFPVSVRTVGYTALQTTTGSTISVDSSKLILEQSGDLRLPDSGGIVFDRNNTSIRVGMGFHIASGEGISLEAIDETNPNNLVYKSWGFNAQGEMSFPNNTIQTTAYVPPTHGNSIISSVDNLSITKNGMTISIVYDSSSGVAGLVKVAFNSAIYVSERTNILRNNTSINSSYLGTDTHVTANQTYSIAPLMNVGDVSVTYITDTSYHHVYRITVTLRELITNSQIATAYAIIEQLQ